MIKDDHGIKQPKLVVATTNMSTAPMAAIWFRRKARRVGEGDLERRGRHLPRGRAHLDAELEQFVVDTRSAPEPADLWLIEYWSGWWHLKR